MERRGADRSGARSARSIYSHAETCAPAGRQIDMRKISLFMAMMLVAGSTAIAETKRVRDLPITPDKLI